MTLIPAEKSAKFAGVHTFCSSVVQPGGTGIYFAVVQSTNNHQARTHGASSPCGPTLGPPAPVDYLRTTAALLLAPCVLLAALLLASLLLCYLLLVCHSPLLSLLPAFVAPCPRISLSLPPLPLAPSHSHLPIAPLAACLGPHHRASERRGARPLPLCRLRKGAKAGGPNGRAGRREDAHDDHRCVSRIAMPGSSRCSGCRAGLMGGADGRVRAPTSRRISGGGARAGAGGGSYGVGRGGGYGGQWAWVSGFGGGRLQ